MKKIITLSLLSSIILMADNPIHDKMDSRIKGKSYSGGLDDNVAAEDGLGIIPLSSYSMTTDVANELLVQTILNKIEKSETDKTKTVNIKDSLVNGLVGTNSDLTYYNKVLSGSTPSFITNVAYTLASYTFTGSQKIDTGLSQASLISRGFKFEADVTFDNVTGSQGLLGMHSGSYGTNGIYCQTTNANDGLGFGGGNGSSWVGVGNTPINKNQKYNIKIEYISGVAKVYFDGVLTAESNIGNINGAGNLMIGDSYH